MWDTTFSDQGQNYIGGVVYSLVEAKRVNGVWQDLQEITELAGLPTLIYNIARNQVILMLLMIVNWAMKFSFLKPPTGKHL